MTLNSFLSIGIDGQHYNPKWYHDAGGLVRYGIVSHIVQRSGNYCISLVVGKKKNTVEVDG